MFDKIIAKTTGHILIKDAITGEILVDKQNAIHYENLSIAIAKSLARRMMGGF